MRPSSAAAPSSPPPAPQPDGPTFADFANAIRKKRPTLGGSLLHVRPLAFGRGGVTLGCDSSFDESQLSQPDVRAFLEAEARQLFGTATPVEVVRLGAKPPDGARPDTLTEVEERARAARKADRGAAARESPAVKQIQDALGARIARIRVVDED